MANFSNIEKLFDTYFGQQPQDFYVKYIIFIFLVPQLSLCVLDYLKWALLSYILFLNKLKTIFRCICPIPRTDYKLYCKHIYNVLAEVTRNVDRR